jgi:arginase
VYQTQLKLPRIRCLISVTLVELMMKSICIWGAPVDAGSRNHGCLWGADALRAAGMTDALRKPGIHVTDMGNLQAAGGRSPAIHANTAIHRLQDCADWVDMLQETAYRTCRQADVPIFLGGDHLISAGTVSGVARYAAQLRREQFIIWLDAHTDLHTLDSTRSGNLHGTPVAYFTGQPGFEGCFPAVDTPVKPQNICMLGIRSVDDAEREILAHQTIGVHDMRAIDERGIAEPLSGFLQRVHETNGQLHVSLDVDFLDPEIAPAVGTTVPGGATCREAHEVMEMLHESGLVTSLDIAELNPFLDIGGKTAKLLVDLVASLFGKSVMNRSTRRY